MLARSSSRGPRPAHEGQRVCTVETRKKAKPAPRASLCCRRNCLSSCGHYSSMTFRPGTISLLHDQVCRRDQGGLPTGGPPTGPDAWTATADRSDIQHALLHVVTDADLRWHRAEDIDACAWRQDAAQLVHHAAAVSTRPPGVYTLMAMSRCRDALVRHVPPAEPCAYPPLVPDILTSCFNVLHREAPDTRCLPSCLSSFRSVARILNSATNTMAPLLMQTSARRRTCAKLTLPLCSLRARRRLLVAAKHVQALRFGLRAETLSHAPGLTAHTAIVLFGSSKFLGRDELGHSRTTVGLTRPRAGYCLGRSPRSVRPH